MNENELTLYEDIFLLALKEEDGKVHSKASFLCHVLAGGIIMELVLKKALHIDPNRKKTVHVMQNPIQGPTLLQESLEIISDTKKKRDLPYWIQKLAQIKDLKERVGMGLVAKGILKAQPGRLLWVFNTLNFPELDPQPELDLIQDIRRALNSDQPIPLRTGLLIGLTSKSGLLQVPFSNQELRAWKSRIRQVSKGEHISDATKEVIAAAQSAMAIAAILPVITSAAIH